MKKNKIITKFISKGLALAALIGIIPGSALAAETQVNNDSPIVATDTTTGAAVTIVNNSNDNDNSSTATDDVNVDTVDFDSQYDNAKGALENFKATNSTDKADILDSVKNSVDSSIIVSFKDGTFNKNEASETSEGEITGTLILQYGDESQELNLDLSIEKLNNDQVQQATQEVTTDASATVNDTTGAAVTVDDNEPTSLKTEIEGTVSIGNTIDDKVTGYNAEGNKVELNEDDINYKWIETWKDENGNENSKEVGESKQLVITKDMDGKEIDCQVAYDDGKGDNK